MREAHTMTYTEINGVGLRYELTGKGEHTIVLVHEMGGTMESWDEVRAAPCGLAPRAAL